MIGKHLGFITEVNKIQHINSIGFGVEIEIKSMVRARRDAGPADTTYGMWSLCAAVRLLYRVHS